MSHIAKAAGPYWMPFSLWQRVPRNQDTRKLDNTLARRGVDNNKGKRSDP